MRLIFTFLFFLFSFIKPLVHQSCDHFIMTYIVLYSFIYMLMYVFFTYSTCVVSFLSLYTCFFMYAIFISVSHKMRWWVLFKCFRKIGCESLPCHKLSSCKVFQEFMLGLDLFCNSTSDYEFSDLRLPSWFVCLLWFYHELPKGEIVRDILI